ncbi:hypothetical protein [Thiolapillus sp.]
MKVTRLFSISQLCCTLLFSNSETTTYQELADKIPEIRPGILQGSLPQQALPDSLKLLPPAPVPGTAEDHRDIAVILQNA